MFRIIATNDNEKEISIDVTVKTNDYKKAKKCVYWLSQAFNDVRIKDCETGLQVLTCYEEPELFVPTREEKDCLNMVEYELKQEG